MTPFPTATAAPVEAPPAEPTAGEETASDGEETAEEAAPTTEPTIEATQLPTPIPGVTVAGLSRGDIAYVTDFTQGWISLTDPDSASSSFPSEQSYVFNLDINRRWFVNTTQINEADFIAQVTTTTTPACPDGAGYGLFFRYGDDSNYFAVTIFCTGRVAVFARSANVLIQPALLDTSLPSGLSASDGQPHQITIAAKGSNFTILFDGQEVGSFTSDLHPRGDIALYAVSSATQGYQVIFQQLEVYEVNP